MGAPGASAISSKPQRESRAGFVARCVRPLRSWRGTCQRWEGTRLRRFLLSCRANSWGRGAKPRLCRVSPNRAKRQLLLPKAEASSQRLGPATVRDEQDGPLEKGVGAAVTLSPHGSRSGWPEIFLALLGGDWPGTCWRFGCFPGRPLPCRTSCSPRTAACCSFHCTFCSSLSPP